MVAENQTYGMTASCGNCGHTFTAQIPKGMKVADYGGECPNCGVADIVMHKHQPLKIVPNPWPLPSTPPPVPYPWWSKTTWTINASDSTTAQHDREAS